MGYDIERFVDEIDEELKCPVCCGVLEDPVQGRKCEHAFCRKCIVEWVRTSETCPVDRCVLQLSHLQTIPRIIRNLLNHLRVRCDFVLSGCQEVLKLEDLLNHREVCKFNPEYPVPCPKDCGALVPKNKMDRHDCVRELRLLLCNQQKEINELKNSITSLISIAEEQRQNSAANQESLSSLIDKYDHLTMSIQNLEKPIKEVLMIASRNSKAADTENAVNNHIKTALIQEATTEIYISNVDRGVTPPGLKDYLFRHDINPLSCKEALRRGWKNDFRVVIFKSDVNKILQSNLWPRGICCFVCGEYYTTKTEGSRDPEEGGTLNNLKACMPPWMAA
ncbi:RING finger protein-like protein [Dinothrombium tinctorium]|uniref:RING finger protein-like protein n=1 Tax=Dinothrombium tinctorium TaxID=1965070 RepID=A0A3S3S0Q1_9ACAR|nr:RING finger protein-like protein [Dinothrombium tinctorium]RWS09203.1 RING finger protein-like protein [Dinothrombium tinctorium]